MPREDKRPNRDVLRSTPLRERVQYRNVYEEQQLERTRPPKKIAATSRLVMLWAGTVVCALVLWVIIAAVEAVGYMASGGTTQVPFGYFMGLDKAKLFVELLVIVPAHLIVRKLLMNSLRAQNLLADDADINQHLNDQHIALPEEVMSTFDFFPDAGAHSNVQVSTMISHVMLDNKGVNQVDVVVPEEGPDADPESEFDARLAGDREALDIVKKPMFDRKFGDKLYEASGLPKELRYWYDPRKIPYNKNNENRDKLKGYDTVADLVNGDWELPLYETQRPAGAYVVDTAPVNTMVLAITRAGKGQLFGPFELGFCY